MNDLPSTEASWSSRRSSGSRPSSRAATSACSVSGTSSASTSPGRPVDVALTGEQAAVEQHPHRLDRVERHALGAGEDLGAELARAGPARSPSSSCSIARPESGSSESVVALRPPAPNVGPALGQLGPREREHEQRVVARPLEQVLDEVEQAGVGPLEVLEDEHGRPLLGEPLEEEPPGREEILPVGRGPLREPEQVGEPRLEPAPLLRVGDVLLDRGPELRERGLGRLLLEDPGPHRAPSPRAPSRRRRPRRRDSGRGATRRCLDQAVDVLLELPREPRLPDPGDARRPRRAVPCPPRRDAVEELLDEAQLAVAADERRLEARRLLRAAAVRGHPERPVERDRLGLPLQLVLARRLVGDRRLGRPPRRLADEDRSRLGRRLDPRRRVDEVAGDHPLAVGPERHRRLAGQDAGAGRRGPASSSGTAATRSSAARTARSASSSFATGVPQTAITASPMNFSTVPP